MIEVGATLAALVVVYEVAAWGFGFLRREI